MNAGSEKGIERTDFNLEVSGRIGVSGGDENFHAFLLVERCVAPGVSSPNVAIIAIEVDMEDVLIVMQADGRGLHWRVRAAGGAEREMPVCFRTVNYDLMTDIQN